MESIRQQLLNAELKRIEEEAEAQSYAVMNQADALVAAHELCQRVNAIEPAISEFSPTVFYHSVNKTAKVMIYPNHNGDIFLRRCQDLGLALEVTNTTTDRAYVAVEGVKGVQVYLDTRFVSLITTAEAA